MSLAISIILGFIFDMVFGDPYNFPHPIIYIGKLISFTENKLRNIFPKNKKGALWGGIVLMLIVTMISFLIPLFITRLLFRINFWLGFIIQTFWVYQILATKCLKTESMKVYSALKEKDIKKSRLMISYLVGRDTNSLDEQEITKACIETIAENTSDGVIAPLFFILIGGVPLGFLYKAVNTLDSMVGYKNEKYLYFGRASAYMDDILNFIPARISGLLMIISAKILKLNNKSAWRIFKRDRKNHLSPNSAQTESAVAGALEIQLGGTHNYFGKPVIKKTIGDNIREVKAEDIKITCNILYTTATIAMLIFAVISIITKLF